MKPLVTPSKSVADRMNTPFYFHPGELDYTFGPRHPLKPERLRRALKLAEAVGIEVLRAPDMNPALLEKVHTHEYIEFVKNWSPDCPRAHGFGTGDNPGFVGMYESAVGYCSASLAAADAVALGAPVAFNIGGGLHHAQASYASGFCIFNDLAVAINRLKETFDRVAYVDIDVHHGDGVQALFYNDPNILAFSIHEEGRTLYPGTGWREDSGGPDAPNTSVNVPLVAGTSGDIWLQEFRSALQPAMERFQPEAIVLQMGTDAHRLDPLAHLACSVQDWLGAVKEVKSLGLPTVAVGGGGYNLTTVPRMWIAAVLTLMDRAVPSEIPADLQEELQATTFFDDLTEFPRGTGGPARAFSEF